MNNTVKTTTRTTTVEALADQILAAKAELAIAEKALKALQTDLLALAPVGTEIVREGGKVTVTERTDLIADVEALREVASRSNFKSLTKTVFDVAGYRALVTLGRSTPEIDAVVGEKVSAPFLVTTVARK
jgi:antitoxin (DNA-binding transcriptional repressor) of toxin-antitoxin stability system